MASAKQFHTDESGMISIIAVITIFFFAILIALVANIGIAVNHKIETQNAADAVALSCATQQARCMNSITAANHLIGELLAAVVLHESIGRRFASDSKEGVQDTSSLDNVLTIAKLSHDVQAVQAMSMVPKKPDTPAYDKIHSKVHSVYALLDSYKSLKQELIYNYTKKNLALYSYNLGLAASLVPPTTAAGLAAMKVSGVAYSLLHLEEELILAEWMILKNVIEPFAKSTAETPRETLYKSIRLLQKFADESVAFSVYSVPELAINVAEANKTEGFIFPKKPLLPIERERVSPEDIVNDPCENTNEKPSDYAKRMINKYRTTEFGRSQVSQTTYPWVNFHRNAVCDSMQWLRFSKFAKHYSDWTTVMSICRCARYTRDVGPMWIMRDSGPSLKGAEPWTTDTRSAERLFTLIGFSKRPGPQRWASSYFPATNTEGTLAFAQSILYNANEQKRVPGRQQHTKFQPVVGWDTLNWDRPKQAVVEWPEFTSRGPAPNIRLNWQSKLVPVSRLPEAVFQISGEPLLNRIQPTNPISRLH